MQMGIRLERIIGSKFGTHMEYIWGYSSAKLCICMSVHMSVVMSLVNWYTQMGSQVGIW